MAANLDITYTDGSMPSIREMQGINEKVAQSIKDKFQEHRPRATMTKEVLGKDIQLSDVQIKIQESAIDVAPEDDGQRTPTVTEIKKQKTNKSKKTSSKGKHKKNQKSNHSEGGKDASVEDDLIKNIRASRKLETLDLSDDEA